MKSLSLKPALFCVLALLFANTVCADYNPERIKDYTALVNAWNDAHNNWHFKDLEKLYSQKVLFYGATINRQECISYKTSLASPTKVFAQKVISDIKTTEFGKGVIKCEFTKEVIIDDKKAQYPAYLILKEINDSLKIICESDEITDASFGFSPGPELFQPKEPGAETAASTPTETTTASRWPIYSFGSAALIVIIALAVRRRKKNQGT